MTNPITDHGRPRTRLRAAAIAAAAIAAAAMTASALALLGAPPAARAAAPAVSVFPIPGDQVATRRTEIVIRGVPTSQFGAIKVVGSKSGVHTGIVKSDSDGQGGSFIPSKPFRAGETVTVTTGLNVIGGTAGSWRFTVETPAQPNKIKLLPTAPRTKGDVLNFRTQPGLKPAAVKVLKSSRGAAPGDLFIGTQAGPLQNDVEIVNSAGALVYAKSVPHGDTATDFRVQTFDGQPVLTWSQGRVTKTGTGRGVDEIYNSSYQHVATVHAGNDLAADLHEFLLGPGDTAWVTAYQPVIMDASKIKHGSKHEIVYDAVAQEIDIKTGLVLYQWDSVDHVPLGASYSPVARRTGTPWDYFHINAIQPLSDGTVLISSRNTSAIYDVSGQTGKVNWVVGGKFSTFKLGAGARFWYQHDARIQANGQLTLFDDAGSPFREKQSRGLTLNLNAKTKTATVAHQVTHSPALRAAAEGNLQLLPNGDELVGWGAAKNFTEFNPKGQIVFDARFVGANSTYRAYRFPWTGTPKDPPAVATHVYKGQTSVSASWNGTTVTAKWRILSGSSVKSLKTVAVDRKTHFETTMETHRRLSGYVEVQALNAAGQVLGTSRAVKAS